MITRVVQIKTQKLPISFYNLNELRFLQVMTFQGPLIKHSVCCCICIAMCYWPPEEFLSCYIFFRALQLKLCCVDDEFRTRVMKCMYMVRSCKRCNNFRNLWVSRKQCKTLKRTLLLKMFHVQTYNRWQTLYPLRVLPI